MLLHSMKLVSTCAIGESKVSPRTLSAVFASITWLAWALTAYRFTLRSSCAIDKAFTLFTFWVPVKSKIAAFAERSSEVCFAFTHARTLCTVTSVSRIITLASWNQRVQINFRLKLFIQTYNEEKAINLR